MLQLYTETREPDTIGTSFAVALFVEPDSNYTFTPAFLSQLPNPAANSGAIPLGRFYLYIRNCLPADHHEFTLPDLGYEL